MKSFYGKFLMVTAVLAVLTACGGGGGSGGSSTADSSNVIVKDLNFSPKELMANINMKTASGYSGTDVLFFNLLGKGDINGDGYEDLVIGLFRHNTVVSYSGREYDPSGEIKPVVLFYDPAANTYRVDQQLQMVIRPNQHPRQVAIVDIDGDGRKDIFIQDHGYDDAPYGNQNSLTLNKSTGWVDGTALLPQYSDFSHGLIIADFDKDNKQDLLVLNNRVTNLTKCQTYSGFAECFYTPPKYSESYVLFNRGVNGIEKGALNIPDSIINFRSTTADMKLRLYVANSRDLNNDTWPDIVVANHKDIFILESTGSQGNFNVARTFGPLATMATCPYTPVSAFEFIDIDEDGAYEIIASQACDLNTATFRVFKRVNDIWEEKTNELIADQTANTILASINDGWCYKFEVADINGDGKKDLICQSTRGQGNGVGNNNVFWVVKNKKLEFGNIILNSGNWSNFHTKTRHADGEFLIGFNFSMANSNLTINRWKN